MKKLKKLSKLRIKLSADEYLTHQITEHPDKRLSIFDYVNDVILSKIYDVLGDDFYSVLDGATKKELKDVLVKCIYIDKPFLYFYFLVLKFQRTVDYQLIEGIRPLVINRPVISEEYIILDPLKCKDCFFTELNVDFFIKMLDSVIDNFIESNSYITAGEKEI